MKEMNDDSLKEFNGKDGRPVYVGYQGRVYDVSASRFWKTGVHMKRHPSGRDLTIEIHAAPHGTEVLDRFPQVGTLKKEMPAERPLPAWLEGLLQRFPLLRRHPHPMVVHFPIVFMFSAAIFNLLYLAFGYPPFETTALHCLGGGILFTPLAMATGFFTWWLNYLAKPSRGITIKIYGSLALFAFALTALIWRLTSSGVPVSIDGAGVLYLILVVSLIPLVTVVGWYGAKFTFPFEK